MAVESSEPATLVELARRGRGVAVLSRSPALAHADARVVVAGLRDVTERACLGLVARRGHLAPAPRQLLERRTAWADPAELRS